VFAPQACLRRKRELRFSFTVETDGKLPTGQTLQDAIERVDEATNSTPEYYMINCAHPTHFAGVLVADEPWITRIRGIRANASTLSHAELNESAELDEGNPVESVSFIMLRKR
jgi:S-methylmethionine-dependent homocysteine/selenocysteine methylase